ncbi:MAG: lysylphosphatidylglycerol synthase transmembrane domain-containing protein [Nitrospinota bacterium]
MALDAREPPAGWRPWAKAALSLAVMAGFLWLAFRRIPLGEFLRAMGEAHLFPILPYLALQVLANALRAWRWKLFLQGAAPRLRRRDAFAALMVGYAVNVAVPRGGELARGVFLQRVAGVPLAAGLSSVIAERLLDLLTMALLFPLALLAYRGRLEGVFPGIGAGVALTALASAGALAAAWWLGRNPQGGSLRLAGYLQRLSPGFAERARRTGGHFLEGLGGLFRRENAPAVALLTAAIWLLYALGFWALFYSFPFARTAAPGLEDALGITLVVAIAYALPSPGGAGTTHFFASQFLIGLLQVDPGQALAYATLVHALGGGWVIVLGGGYAFFARPKKNK